MASYELASVLPSEPGDGVLLLRITLLATLSLVDKLLPNQLWVYRGGTHARNRICLSPYRIYSLADHLFSRSGLTPAIFIRMVPRLGQ